MPPRTRTRVPPAALPIRASPIAALPTPALPTPALPTPAGSPAAGPAPAGSPATGPAAARPRPAYRVTRDSFIEADYLESNLDVAEAVAAGVLPTGWAHFELYGHREGRRARPAQGIAALRVAKLARLAPLLDLARPHGRREGKYDFRTDDERRAADQSRARGLDSTHYGDEVQALLKRHDGDLVLDCGAGNRRVYHPNIVYLDLVDHPATDVLANAARLPFHDNSFDAVLCLGLLEHAADPFACAREIARVLKPGGELLCGAPFLQPQDGQEPHFFTMAPMGLRALFAPALDIADHRVTESALPIWSLTWIVHSWAAALPPAARDEFTALRIGDLLGQPHAYLDRAWVRDLPGAKNLELACGTLLSAFKPGPRKRPPAPPKAPRPKAAVRTPAKAPAKTPAKASTKTPAKALAKARPPAGKPPQLSRDRKAAAAARTRSAAAPVGTRARKRS